jgi:hypothetical protein
MFSRPTILRNPCYFIHSQIQNERAFIGPARCHIWSLHLIASVQWQEKHVDAGKPCKRSVVLFILCISLITKIEIVGKCCRGHSNHELKQNAAILIQITKNIDALFWEIYTIWIKPRIVYMFFLHLHVFSCHCTDNATSIYKKLKVAWHMGACQGGPLRWG